MGLILVKKLKLRLIDDVCAQGRRFRHLQGMLAKMDVRALRDQSKVADSGIVVVILCEPIADRKRMFGAQLHVEAGTYADAPKWAHKGLRVRIDNRQRGRVQDAPVDDGAIAHHPPVRIDEERGAPIIGPLRLPPYCFRSNGGFSAAYGFRELKMSLP